MRVASNATGDAVLWTHEAKLALVKLAEDTISKAAEAAAERTLAENRAKVKAEDVNVPEVSSRASEEPQDYTSWLEEANEAFARALKKAGIPLPKLPPTPRMVKQ